MAKKNLSKEQLYLRNKKIVKVLRVTAPIVRWGLLALGIFFLCMAVKNSFGNLGEIIDKLDSSVYTGEELRENYAFLCQKYGEWQIGNGSTGFSLMFVNIKQAMFSGFMITSCICSLVSFVGSGVFGKWFMPLLARNIESDNQNMVNLEILKQ